MPSARPRNEAFFRAQDTTGLVRRAYERCASTGVLTLSDQQLPLGRGPSTVGAEAGRPAGGGVRLPGGLLGGEVVGAVRRGEVGRLLEPVGVDPSRRAQPQGLCAWLRVMQITLWASPGVLLGLFQPAPRGVSAGNRRISKARCLSNSSTCL